MFLHQKGSTMATRKSSSTSKSKTARKRKSTPRLLVTDHDWGSIYSGSKEALIRSGLVTAQEFPKSQKAGILGRCSTWFYNGECARKVTWSYENGVWRAWVHYNVDEIAPSKIIRLAQAAVSNAMAQLQYDIGQCRPAPLSETLGIKAHSEQKADGVSR
jgi:predicted lipase